MTVVALLLIAGFIILIKGADFLVSGAASIATRAGISNLAIGLTVVAFGTSMPEMVVNLISGITGRNDAAFGNVVGSNNFNLLMILGLSGVIFPLVVQRKTVRFEIPMSLAFTLLLYVLVNDSQVWGSSANVLSRLDGVILLVGFAGFLLYIYRTMKQASDYEQEGTAVIFSTGRSTGLIFFGLLMLIGGGKLAVDNAVKIAEYFGLSEKLIGLTILAAGTSLPELATSAVAAYRKNTDIAIGNVVGSNIFNLSLILGLNGLIKPIPYNTLINFDLHVLIGTTVLMLLFMYTLNKRKLDRSEAIILLAAYIAYMVYLFRLEGSATP